MKKTLFTHFFYLLLSVSMFGGSTSTTIDWPSYIARHDLHWNSLPQKWDEAPFVGNGMLGSMVFQEGENCLIIQFGRGDVQEHRMESGIEAVGNILPDSSRLPVGFFTLNLSGEIEGCYLRLNLWDAEISGTVATSHGVLELQIIAHSDRDLLLVHAEGSSEKLVFDFEWHPEEAFCPRVKSKRKNGSQYRPEYEGNPSPVLSKTNEINLCVQELAGGGETATAWKVLKNEKSKSLYASIGHTFPEINADEIALSDVQEGIDSNWSGLIASHRKLWHEFYPCSFVSLPDQRMESFFWIQHYKMACATKGGRLLADNQGVWLQPTGWPALWWNLNVQLAYSHMLPANHPEFSVGLVNHLYKYRENLSKNVPEDMQKDSAAIHTVSGQDLLSPIGDPSDLKAKRSWATGNLTWALHNCYMQYRYTMDEDLLQEKIFPLLKRAINYYRHFLVEGEDGKIHLPATLSPEYPGSFEDCNYDLALLRWGCEALVDTCEILNINDPLLPEWKDILNRLTDYPVGESGLLIGKDTPYAKSHRHYSHLLMIYPLMTLTPETNRALIEKSLLHWQSLPEALAGYSFSGSSSMFSLLGNGEMAEIGFSHVV